MERIRLDCPRCGKVTDMDALSEKEIRRWREYCGVFVSTPAGWSECVSHCRVCHFIVASIIPGPTVPVGESWPGENYVTQRGVVT